MNKFTLVSRSLHHTSKSLYQRVLCLLRGEKYDPNPGPQWQQLELPFSRTPVRRWNR